MTTTRPSPRLLPRASASTSPRASIAPWARPLARWATLLAVGAATLGGAPEASAQEASSVTGDGKGIVGGALLGAEIVTIPMGLAGLEPWWPYAVFGSVGAVGGAFGGYAVEQSGAPAEAPLYMLAGGLALVIPALVVSLNATTFSDYEDESDPSVEPPAGPPPVVPPAEGGATFQIQSDASKAPRRRTPRAPTPRARTTASLVAVEAGALHVGAPGVEVRPLYTADEIARFGVQQSSEVRVPVFAAQF